MKIFNEYNNVIEDCPFCGSDKTRIIMSKKRSGKNRKYFPGYKVICFKCWSCTAIYFFIDAAIKAWNTRVKIIKDFNNGYK